MSINVDTMPNIDDDFDKHGNGNIKCKQALILRPGKPPTDDDNDDDNNNDDRQFTIT